VRDVGAMLPGGENFLADVARQLDAFNADFAAP
jgi:hypothetical protein